MALSNAERQARHRAKRRRNHVYVTLLAAAPDNAAEIRKLQGWLTDPDTRVTSITVQDPKTGRLKSHRL
jgi:hypothetical protein